MTEQATDERKTITFEGRELDVKVPTVEKLAVMQDLVENVNRVQAKGNLSGAQTLAYVRKSQGLIKAMLVNADDREWLDYMFLVEDLSLEKAFEIVSFATEKILEGAPANGPAPKKAAARRVKK